TPRQSHRGIKRKKLIFSFMKTIRFQTFLFDPEVEPRGIL
ncbi:MAG: hypothetical protein ACI9Y7_002284, partial [Dokdonia sp.]